MIRTLTLVPAVLFCAVIAAQPGSIDHSFNATDIGFGHGDGARLAVHATVLQPDGKILIAGKFTTYNGTARNRIARLNVDGSLDTTFDPGTGSSGTVYCLAMQPDGKVLIGGYFSSYNGTLRNNIARINNDGSLDTTFDPGSGPNEVVRSITVQPDGKILIGGVFTSYDGTPTNYITRVNADGSLDTSFNIGTGADILITSIVLQPDGKILVGGWFNSFNGSPIDFFARLNADGTLDAGFDTGTGPSSTISSIAVQADGRIIIVGDFANYNGVGRNRIARVNADGSLDTSFDPGAGANNDVETVALQADGKVLIGGWFTDYNGVGPDRLARLEADGDMDASFNPGAGPNATVWSIVVQPDGKSLVGDDFSYDNLTGHNHVSRRNIDGSIDLSFNPGTGTNGSVYSFAVQPDGKILIAGDFTSFNGVARIRVARLHADGSLDASFDPGSGPNDWVSAVIVQPDGKILIGGGFTTYSGAARKRIARLTADGSLDASFSPPSAANDMIAAMALQPDGKILIGGRFTSYQGVTRNRIARLMTNGVVDGLFDPGAGADDLVAAIAVQPDGKILIGGDFTGYNNNTGGDRIARLNPDGSLDPTFHTGAEANDRVQTIAVQTDSKILIGGDFTSYNGMVRNRLARLNADGNLDLSFNTGTGPSGGVYSLALQQDARILVGGMLATYNGVLSKQVARVSTDGSLDVTFDTGLGANDPVWTIALQPDGKLLIGGEFTDYDGTGRNRVARLNGDTGISSGEDPGPNDVLRVFPNPTTGLVHIDHPMVGATELIVMDSFGRVVMTRSHGSSASPGVLDLQGLATGVYHLELRSADPPVRSTVLLQR